MIYAQCKSMKFFAGGWGRDDQVVTGHVQRCLFVLFLVGIYVVFLHSSQFVVAAIPNSIW